MRIYGGPSCFEIPSDDEMLSQARRIAHSMQWRTPLAAQNSYMTPVERMERGFLCEIAFSAWAGVPYQVREGVIPQRRAADVGDCEVKWMGWRKAEHMDQCEGGTLYVVPEHSHAAYTVGMTCFDATLSKRVFIEGWIRTQDAAAFPRGGRPRDRDGTRSRYVPYVAMAPIWGHAAEIWEAARRQR